MYAVETFQPDIPMTLGVTSLQSGNSKKIDLYRKHWENKLQVLQKQIYCTNGMSYEL